MEDGSNASDDYSRNLIRHHVSPVLRKINPELHLAVARTAKLLEEDEDCLGSLADEFIREHYDGESLPVKELGQLHRAVSSRVIRRLCRGSLSYEQVQQALADNGEVTSARRVYNREVTYIRVPELRLLLSSLTPQEAFGLGLASVQQNSDDGKLVIE